MAERFTYLLIGGGLTSASAARAIREHDALGTVAILGAEAYLPYDRPPLSKNLLSDPSLTAGDIASVDDDFYRERHVRVLTGIAALAIDRQTRTVRASDGQAYGYDKLLLATGSRPRPLDAEGDGAARVLLLRSYDDAVRLRQSLDSASSAVLVGAGYIGMEVAAACVAKGVRATIVEGKGYPWSKFASPRMGAFLVSWYERQEVRFIFDDQVARVDVGAGGLRVGTRKGVELNADVVLAGIGVQYNTEIARDCGLDVDERGRVKVNATLRTPDPNVWAAGDYAAYPDSILDREFNAEHYMNAKWQGAQVGANMAAVGAGVPFAQVPYFFSDMGKLHMILRGKSDDVANTRILGDPDTGKFVELYPGPDGELKMAIAVNADGDDKRLDQLSDRFEDLIRRKVAIASVAEGDLAP